MFHAIGGESIQDKMIVSTLMRHLDTVTAICIVKPPKRHEKHDTLRMRRRNISSVSASFRKKVNALTYRTKNGKRIVKTAIKKCRPHSESYLPDYKKDLNSDFEFSLPELDCLSNVDLSDPKVCKNKKLNRRLSNKCNSAFSLDSIFFERGSSRDILNNVKRAQNSVSEKLQTSSEKLTNSGESRQHKQYNTQSLNRNTIGGRSREQRSSHGDIEKNEPSHRRRRRNTIGYKSSRGASENISRRTKSGTVSYIGDVPKHDHDDVAALSQKFIGWKV